MASERRLDVPENVGPPAPCGNAERPGPHQGLRHLATPTGPGTQDAAGASYSLVDADEGNTIKVKVSFADDAGNEESLTSVATASIEARPNSPAAGAPTISGTVQVGEMLTASTW